MFSKISSVVITLLSTLTYSFAQSKVSFQVMGGLPSSSYLFRNLPAYPSTVAYQPEASFIAGLSLWVEKKKVIYSLALESQRTYLRIINDPIIGTRSNSDAVYKNTTISCGILYKTISTDDFIFAFGISMDYNFFNKNSYVTKFKEIFSPSNGIWQCDENKWSLIIPSNVLILSPKICIIGKVNKKFKVFSEMALHLTTSSNLYYKSEYRSQLNSDYDKVQQFEIPYQVIGKSDTFSNFQVVFCFGLSYNLF